MESVKIILFLFCPFSVLRNTQIQQWFSSSHLSSCYRHTVVPVQQLNICYQHVPLTVGKVGELEFLYMKIIIILYFLRVLKKSNISNRLLVSFYRCSILMYCLCVWFSSPEESTQEGHQDSPEDRRFPYPLTGQSAQCSLHQIGTEHCEGHFHPGHSLFELLPSGRRYRVIK